MPIKGWKSRTHGSARQLGKRFQVYDSRRPKPKHWKKRVPSAVKSASEKEIAKLVDYPDVELSAQEKKARGESLQQTSDFGSSITMGRTPQGVPIRISLASIDALESQANRRGVSGKVVFLSPEEFLRRSPSMLTARIPASLQKRKHFDEESLLFVKEQLQTGQPIDIPMLDYSRMKANWPTHETYEHSHTCALEGTGLS
jgi:hypothetical protein